MMLDRSRRTRLTLRAVALQTRGITRQSEVGLVWRTVDVVTRIAAHPFDRHLTLHVVVSLHPVLVRAAVRPMREAFLAQVMFLEHPDVAQ